VFYLRKNPRIAPGVLMFLCPPTPLRTVLDD
jgi:hypothetical protein